MATVLTIAASDVKRLLSIPAADTSQDGALASLLAAEQLVHEYALDPGILSLAVSAGAGDGCLATLTLGVGELLAGSFLTALGRFPHASEPLPLVSLVPQAATVLTVAAADVKRLCSIPAADTSQDGAISALITQEQLALEYALDPAVLAAAVSTGTPNAALKALLTLGVGELLAASFLTSLGRLPDAAEPLPLGSLAPAAATVLTIPAAAIKALLEITDTSQDTAIAAAITQEQLALEYALDPAVLAAAVSVATPNAALNALLTLGVSEQIAGLYLAQSGRVPGLGVDVQISTLHFTTSHAPSPDKLGAELSAQGVARLEPFLRLPRARHTLRPFSNVLELEKLAVSLASQASSRLSAFSRHVRAEHALRPFANQPELFKLGGLLVSQGLSRLAPFTRAKRAANVAAAGTTPDGYAPIPQLIAGGILPGAIVGSAPTVFASAFADVGNAPDDPDTADNPFGWDEPEP